MSKNKEAYSAIYEPAPLKSRKTPAKVHPSMLNDSIDKDSHSSFGSNNIEVGIPLLKHIAQKLKELQKWYWDTVSLKQESKLLAVSIGLVYSIVGVAIICINYIQLPNKSVAIVIQALYALIGLLAVKWTSVANNRISELSCMVSIVFNEAKTTDIIKASKHKNKTYIFYVSLIGTQLSVKLTPMKSYLGTGSAAVLPFEIMPKNIKNPYEIFIVAVGTQFSCPKCAAFITNGYFLVPVSVQLRDARVKDRQVLESHPQDIVALKTVCKSMEVPEGFETDEYDMVFEVISAIKALSGAIFEVEMRSRAGFHYETYIRRCILSTEDVRGDIVVRYTATPEGRVVRKAVESVKTNNDPNCQVIAGICLGSPLRYDLSYALLSEVFQIGTFNMDQDYSLAAGLFPDPSLKMDDETYGLRIASVVSNILLVAASQRPDHKEEVDLYTDDIAVRFEAPSWLLVIAFGSAVVCAFTGVILISLNMVKLEKTDDQFLHYLSNCIRPGKKQMESYQKFLEYSQENQIGNWDEEILRYGEDVETKKDPVGRLIFGQKEALIKYKNMRKYTQGFT